MLRVVLDTNVVISALLFRGPTSQLVECWRDKKFIPVVSKAVVEEYLRVLAYSKFQLSVVEVRSLIERQLLPFAEPVEVTDIPVVIRQDPSDNIFLACAYAGRARYLVSGDRHLLTLKRYRGIPILTVRSFLSKLLIKT